MLFRLWSCCWFAFCLLPAQEVDTPIGLLRGAFVESMGTDGSGDFKIKLTTGPTYSCIYDEKTYMEHTSMRIFVSSLRQGDPIEVVGDRSRFPGRCYARTIHVVDPPVASHSRIRPYRMVTEHIAPRGDLTFSGVVVRMEGEMLTLRTRAAGDVVLLLRQDTRFLDSGIPIERTFLKPNMRVFIRAGKNLEKQTEAYQIFWGEIMKGSPGSQ